MSEPAPNNPLPGRAILLPISQCEWRRIREGKQTAILRKKWARQCVDRAVLYVNSPPTGIVCAVRLGPAHSESVLQILDDSPRDVWDEIEGYFGEDLEYGWVIPIQSFIIKADYPFGLNLYGIERPPSTFRYLNDDAVDVLSDAIDRLASFIRGLVLNGGH